MGRYAAFLRGMNLGKRRIKNTELVANFERMGLLNVEAFLASGNVAFQGRGSARALEVTIERELQAALNYQVPTFVRTEEELRAIAKATPFAARKGRPREGKLQVALLKTAPSTEAAQGLRAFESVDDWLAIIGQELYWWPSGGISESEIDWKGIDTLLGAMTIRTHRTMERLVTKCF